MGKKYAVRQHIECPSNASQQSVCNDPAPRYPACLYDHKAGPARYVACIADSSYKLVKPQNNCYGYNKKEEFCLIVYL